MLPSAQAWLGDQTGGRSRVARLREAGQGREAAMGQPRTLLEKRIRERRLSLEEFVVRRR